MAVNKERFDGDVFEDESEAFGLFEDAQERVRHVAEQPQVPELEGVRERLVRAP